MYKRILVPIDDSQTARRGLKEAITLATEQKATLCLVHVVDDFPLMLEIPAARDFGPVAVPAGRYLMMGDNRDNSHDSRYFGFVARREIVGEAQGVFISADRSHWLRPRFNRFFSKLD